MPRLSIFRAAQILRRSSIVFMFVCHSMAAVAEPPQYFVEEIGRSTWGLAIANDINNRGMVVGEVDWDPPYGGIRHAVAWIDGEMIDLTSDGAIEWASARAVNDDGYVAGGFYTDGTYPSGGFRWKDNVFDVLPTFAPGHQHGYGISERGYVLGRAMHEHFQVNATVWDPQLSNDFDLGNLGRGIAIAYDANGWDVIVGSSPINLYESHAFLWKDGEMHDLGGLPESRHAYATAINNHNEVVGYSDSPRGDHAFYWSQETGIIELENLGLNIHVSANDINDSGLVVGSVHDGHYGYAAVWDNFELYNLNSLLVNGDGWRLSNAFGVNELGQIVGYAKRDGVYVAYVATPVDAPMTTIIGPSPGRAGEYNDIEVVEATPGADVLVLYSLKAGKSDIAECPGVEVDLAAPRGIIVRADDNGRATLRGSIPEGARGKRLLFQAVDLSNCDVTNLAVRTLG